MPIRDGNRYALRDCAFVPLSRFSISWRRIADAPALLSGTIRCCFDFVMNTEIFRALFSEQLRTNNLFSLKSTDDV